MTIFEDSALKNLTDFMVIEINTETLLRLGLSPDEFVYLSILKQTALVNYLQDTPIKLSIDLNSLQERGWIKIGEDNVPVLRNKLNILTESNFDAMWRELLSNYPIKVGGGSTGTRVLRAADADAQSNKKAKEKYRKIVGNQVDKHNTIVECLQREIAIKRQSNSLAFMQMLDTWLNQYTWEKYMNVTDGDKSPTTQSNGRITRVL